MLDHSSRTLVICWVTEVQTLWAMRVVERTLDHSRELVDQQRGEDAEFLAPEQVFHAGDACHRILASGILAGSTATARCSD